MNYHVMCSIRSTDHIGGLSPCVNRSSSHWENCYGSILWLQVAFTHHCNSDHCYWWLHIFDWETFRLILLLWNISICILKYALFYHGVGLKKGCEIKQFVLNYPLMPHNWWLWVITLKLCPKSNSACIKIIAEIARYLLNFLSCH